MYSLLSWFGTFLPGFFIRYWRIIVPVLFLIFSIRVRIWRNKQKERIEDDRRKAERIMREKQLEEAVLNPNALKQERGRVANTPHAVSVEYSSNSIEGGSAPIQGVRSCYLKVTEKKPYVKTEYVISQDQKLMIGERFGKIMALNGDDPEEKVFCLIYAIHDFFYVKSTGRINVVLERNSKKKIAVDQKGYQLMDGDRVLIDDTEYLVNKIG